MTQKKQSIEYRLLVQPTFDETLKKAGILFLLETSKQFTNFSYVIDVKEEVKGDRVIWTLRGLRAPSMNMPATGTAQFHTVYFDLPKKVHFTLVKKDKIKADTEFTFSAAAFKSTKETSSFLRIYTDQHEFQTNRINDVVMAEPKPDIHRDPAVKKQKIKKTKP
ncbi:MAG: hypothetical protein WDA22_02965 [Bacteroidota bacterium]